MEVDSDLNKIEWIFFDMDGTLADSLDHMYRVYVNFLKSHGIDGNEEEFKKLNGPSIKEIVYYLKKKYCLKDKVTDLVKEYESKVLNAYKKKVESVKGSTSLLNILKKDYKLALVTSSNRMISETFIKKNKWEKYFSTIVCGDEINDSKPKPAIYKLCLCRANANKDNVLVIEDSENGVKSAVAAGLRCIRVDKKVNTLEKITLALKPQ